MRPLIPVALASLAAATISLPATAQVAPRTWGIYAGLGGSTMKGDSVPGPLSKSGVLGGAFITLPLNQHLALQSELLFAQKGVTTLDARATGVVSTDIRLGYLEEAELLRVNAGTWRGSVSPYVLAGPEFGWRLSCSVVVGGLAGNYTCKDVGDGIGTSDFGAIVGAGFDFVIGARKYTIAARYDFGASNIVKNNAAKNRSFGIVAGLVW